MIENIFLPAKFGNYYLFSQKTVGIDITKSHINASIAHYKGSITLLEQHISLPINGDAQNYEQRVIDQLAVLKQKIGKVDQIKLTIASTQAVFKELRLPFISYEKISLIIEFEVEPLLPFPVKNAVIDFIITDIDKENQTAQVLVAAVQKEKIAYHLSLFDQAGIDPTLITIDMIALYNLYYHIPQYINLQGSVVLLDLDLHHTRIVLIDNKVLRVIRTLGYGIISLFKNTESKDSQKPKELLDHLIRFGIDTKDSTENAKLVTQSLTEYFNKIQFAINSTLNSLQNKTVTKLLLLGAGAKIKDVSSFLHSILHYPCELFDGQLLKENKKFRINPQFNFSTTDLLSIGSAIRSPQIEEFNLKKDEFQQPQRRLFLKQIIVATILVITILGTLVTHSIIQERKLKNEIFYSTDQAIQLLRERFPQIPEEEEDLDDIVKFAREELEKEEKIWLAFSSKARASFLEYLLELSSRINKPQLGFQLDQLTIIYGEIGEITLKAQVRDFEALKQLEQSLRQSKLFSYVEGQTTTDFTMKIKIGQK